jgi:hypothetical protein
MRSHVTDAPDAEEAAGALGENSAELEATIADIYGPDAGAAFGGLWDSHVHSYVDFVSGLEDADRGAQAEALQELSDYWESFSAFLADANPFVSADELEGHIRTHTDMLVVQAEQYSEGLYAQAYETGREAFAHTGELSAFLAVAIADQLPDRFPRTVPNAAVVAETPPWEAMAGIAMLMLAVVLAVVGWPRPAQPSVSPSSTTSIRRPKGSSR